MAMAAPSRTAKAAASEAELLASPGFRTIACAAGAEESRRPSDASGALGQPQLSATPRARRGPSRRPEASRLAHVPSLAHSSCRGPRRSTRRRVGPCAELPDELDARRVRGALTPRGVHTGCPGTVPRARPRPPKRRSLRHAPQNRPRELAPARVAPGALDRAELAAESRTRARAAPVGTQACARALLAGAQHVARPLVRRRSRRGAPAAARAGVVPRAAEPARVGAARRAPVGLAGRALPGARLRVVRRPAHAGGAGVRALRVVGEDARQAPRTCAAPPSPSLPPASPARPSSPRSLECTAAP